MTARYDFAISQAAAPRGLLLFPALFKQRAQGMPGARCARGLVCNGSGRAHTSIQVTPESPGIPHAMVYGLSRALVSAKSARMCERAVLTNRPSLDLSP